jgi:hypothetical protein
VTRSAVLPALLPALAPVAAAFREHEKWRKVVQDSGATVE